MLKQGLNDVKSRIREAAAQAHSESPPRPEPYSWTAAFVLRASFAVSKAGVCAKQELNHAKSRIRDLWRRWVLKQRLNYVNSRIREAAAQAHPRNPRRVPKTYSWTAAFVLRASFAVAKCVVCVSPAYAKKPGTSDPYTWNFLRAQRDIMRPKTAAVSRRKHMDLSPCAQRHVLAKPLLRYRAAR